MNISENKIYEVAYKVIKDSLEWGCDKNNIGGPFYNYIDGVISVSDNLIKEMDKTSNEEC